MNVEVSSAGTPLSQETCRDRLSHSRRGFLACTEHALPTVVPAEVRLRQGQLLVTVHDAGLRDRLVGQVVALGIGRHALRFRRGWHIVARGQLGTADHEDEIALLLEPYQLEGVTFTRPG